MEDSTRNKTRKNPPEIPRGCGLFSLAAWAPSVPSGSSRWPTTVVVLISASAAAASFDVLSLRWIVLSSRLPLRPLAGDRSSSRLPSTTDGPSATAFPIVLGPSSRDFQPPLHASLGHLPEIVRRRSTRTRASRVVRFLPCRRFVSRLCSCLLRFGQLFLGIGREKINFSRHSSGRPWLGHPGSR